MCGEEVPPTARQLPANRPSSAPHVARRSTQACRGVGPGTDLSKLDSKYFRFWAKPNGSKYFQIVQVWGPKRSKVDLCNGIRTPYPIPRTPYPIPSQSVRSGGHASPFILTSVRIRFPFPIWRFLFIDRRGTMSALADMIQASLMLRYNERKVGLA